MSTPSAAVCAGRGMGPWGRDGRHGRAGSPRERRRVSSGRQQADDDAVTAAVNVDRERFVAVTQAAWASPATAARRASRSARPARADLVGQPAKVMWIGSRIKQCSEEVRSAPLDVKARSGPFRPRSTAGRIAGSGREARPRAVAEEPRAHRPAFVRRGGAQRRRNLRSPSPAWWVAGKPCSIRFQTAPLSPSRWLHRRIFSRVSPHRPTPTTPAGQIFAQR
jgi:hypothetical protein